MWRKPKVCVCVCVQPKKNSSSLKSLPKRDQVLGRVFAPQSVQSWDFAGAVERQNFCFEEINTEYQHHPRSGNRHKRPPPNKSAERPHKYTDSGNNAARSSFFQIKRCYVLWKTFPLRIQRRQQQTSRGGSGALGCK